MSDIPQTDWDRIYRWEWFRLASWRPVFRQELAGEGGGLCRAFCDLAKLIGAEVALDAACGLGRSTLLSHDMGMNILGSDASAYAVEKAAELAEMEGASVHYLQSTWSDLPRNIPHRFDALLNDSIHHIPDWDGLGAALVGLCHSLKPGGFLMFLGAGDKTDPDEERWHQQEEWEKQPREFAEWYHRDGSTSCTKVVQKKKADDYIDDKCLYVITEGGAPRLEHTVLRRPAYWTWEHWNELIRTAGFCHLETRVYERYGLDGGPLRVNVAWKLKGDTRPQEAPATQVYED